MGAAMAENPSESENLLARAQGGDEQALAGLFGHYRERLKRMIRLRLDRRLSGRVDASDVLQEAYLDAHKRFADYVWVRRCATPARKSRSTAAPCRKRLQCPSRLIYWER
jgi:DNA-directed RNA polymerase specialized sigma24 family protein